MAGTEGAGAATDRLNLPLHCRASRELFLAQRCARYASPLTTTVYTHPSDQEMLELVRALRC